MSDHTTAEDGDYTEATTRNANYRSRQFDDVLHDVHELLADHDRVEIRTRVGDDLLVESQSDIWAETANQKVVVNLPSGLLHYTSPENVIELAAYDQLAADGGPGRIACPNGCGQLERTDADDHALACPACDYVRDEQLKDYLAQWAATDRVRCIVNQGADIRVEYAADGPFGIGHLRTERMLDYGYAVRMASDRDRSVHFQRFNGDLEFDHEDTDEETAVLTDGAGTSGWVSDAPGAEWCEDCQRVRVSCPHQDDELRTDGGPEAAESTWDPQPAQLREGETRDDAHARRNEEAVRQARRELAKLDDEGDEDADAAEEVA